MGVPAPAAYAISQMAQQSFKRPTGANLVRTLQPASGNKRGGGELSGSALKKTALESASNISSQHSPPLTQYTDSQSQFSETREDTEPSQPSFSSGASDVYLDSAMVVANGAQLKSVRMKLGHAIYPDLITPFLEHIQGKGTVSIQWAGRMLAPEGIRHVHNEVFRHSMSARTDATTGPFPNDMTVAGMFLKPQPDLDLTPIAGSGLVAYANPTPKGIFRDFTPGKDYWVSLTRPDLEDMSWNLNNLKLGAIASNVIANTTYVPPSTLAGFQVGDPPGAPLKQIDSHARQSYIYTNNINVSGAYPQNQGVSIPNSYRYNAVFNKGLVNYSFMNKGLGPAKVDVIVYRVKKNKQLPARWQEYASAQGTDPLAPPVPNEYLYQNLQNGIGRGFVARTVGVIGTENYLGRIPSFADVSTNPNFPLFPKIKQTRQSAMDLSEVQRITFAMPAGSRRNTEIVLPGIVYDPTSIPSKTDAPIPSQATPILDEYSYIITLGVSGCLAANLLVENQNNLQSTVLGDRHTSANVQYYATYTEDIAACQYKSPSRKRVCVNGFLDTPGPTTSGQNYNSEVVVALSQQSTVRNATGVSGAGPGASGATMGTGTNIS